VISILVSSLCFQTQLVPPTNRDEKKAQLAAVNAKIGEKTTDVASLLARTQALLKDASKKSRIHASKAASDSLEMQRGYSAKIDTKTLIQTGPMGTGRMTSGGSGTFGASTRGGGTGAFGASAVGLCRLNQVDP
jgi:hypothetical protein